MSMESVLWIYLALINLVTFFVYGSDKRKAKAGAWRIPEATLLTLAGVGGSLGALLGMQYFRHKTRKPKFTITVPVFLILHITLIAILYYFEIV